MTKDLENALKIILAANPTKVACRILASSNLSLAFIERKLGRKVRDALYAAYMGYGQVDGPIAFQLWMLAGLPDISE